MDISKYHADAWQFQAFSSLLLCSVIGLAPAMATESGSALLTLSDAIDLAMDEQPALVVESATIRALQQETVADEQLPDPQLIGGVMQMPVTNDEAFSLRDDNFTALSVGIAQEFPRAEKRKLRATKTEQQATATEVALAGAGKQVRRDTALAYVDVFAAAAGARLVDELVMEAQRQRSVAEIELTTGQATQAEMLSAGVDLEVQADRGSAFRQQEFAARGMLSRWIGLAADRPVPTTLPALSDPPRLEVLIAGLPEHPAVAETAATVRVAATDLKLAEAQRKPDWRLELRYDHRLEYSDLVTLMVGVDLPLFTGQRQDKRTAAAREMLTASHAQRDDVLREAAAALLVAYRNWQSGTERLQRYDEVLLPESRKRVAAALSGYQSGQARLASLLDARRSLLESELMRLDLQVEVMRERLVLQYFEVESDQ